MNREKREEHSRLKKEHWSEFEYKKWFSTKRGKLVDQLEKSALRKMFEDSHFNQMLDVGIGNGRLMPLYRDKIDKIVCIDISQRLLNEASEIASELNLNAEFIQCEDASQLDFNDEVFDGLICSRVLQHLYEWRSAIKDFHRVLKPGGTLILMTYNRWSIYGIVKWIQHLFNTQKGSFRNPVSLKSVLKRNGFKIENYSGAMIFQPSIIPSLLMSNPGDLLIKFDAFANHRPFNWFGERIIIKARKN